MAKRRRNPQHFHFRGRYRTLFFGGKDHHYRFEVEVDVEALLDLLALKAARNKSGKTRLGHGAIVVNAFEQPEN